MKNFKNIIVVSFVSLYLILSHEGYSQKPLTLYGQNIFSPAHLTEEITLQSIADLKFYLEAATKKPFSIVAVQTTTHPGIYLVLNEVNNRSAGPEAGLSNGSIEDFVIKSNKDKIFLIARHPLGLSRAVYYYLDQLGFRWYFPGSKWEHIPALTDISFNKMQYVNPSFKHRDFFGSGAITLVKSVDPDQKLQNEWDDWKRRNRMGGEVELAGHYGDVFNLAHRAELEKHPEYLAQVGGKRSDWRPDVKWCISNPGLRKLFIQDRILEGQKKLADSKYSTNKITISVDPADGYGDCECAVCKKMGSYSDRVFYLANETAKELAKISSRLYANIYAYNTHAAPPPFYLVSHLIVQLVPYAFQNVSSPKQLIEKWKSVNKSLLVYDYFGIPDWSFNLPLTREQSDDALVKKIKYWKQQQLEGFTLESSYSIGSNGIGLYLAGRLGWDINTDVEKEKALFYKNMFGSSSTALQEYYEKISFDFNGVADLPFLMQILAKAKGGTGGIVKERITDLQAYLHFVSLYYQWKLAKPDRKEETGNEVLKFAWQIYPSAMVHSTRITEILIHNFPVSESHTKSWDPYNPGADRLKNIKFLSRSELETIASKDIDEHPLLEDFAYQLKKIPGSYQLSGVPKKEIIPEGLLLLDIPETYVQSSGKGIIHFYIKVNEASDNNISQAITIECTNPSSGLPIQTKDLVINKNWQEVIFTVAPNQTVKLVIKNKNWIRFYAPLDQWIAFKNIPMYTVMGPLWFYVPKGTKYIYYSNTLPEQPLFTDAMGKAVVPQKISEQNMYKLQINNNSSGNWWTIKGSEYKSLQFYGKPDLFFMRPVYMFKPSKP